MTTAHHRYFSGLSRNTFLLALASLFADISTEMLYPILPIFLTQTLKASGSVVGLIEGVAGATQNIVQGFSGALSDKLQRRKPVALVGYFLAAIGKPLMGAATVWQGVLGGRFLDRLGAGTRSAPRDALIAASVDEANRGRAFGLEGVGDNTGAFLGPLVAVLLLIVWQLDIRLIFYLAVIPGLLAFLMVLLVEERAAAVTAKAKIDINLRQFPKPYWKYLVATALFGIGNSSNAFLILQTKDIGASLTMTILIYAGFNLVAALISYPAGFLSDQLGRQKYLARLVRHLPGGLSRLRLDQEHRTHRRALRPLRALSGNIPLGRQSFGKRLRAGATSRQWHRLVQHDCRLGRIGGQPGRRIAVGSGRARRRVFVRRRFRSGRWHRVAGRWSRRMRRRAAATGDDRTNPARRRCRRWSG